MLFKILLLVLLSVFIECNAISYCRNDPQLKNEAVSFIEKACRNMWILKNSKLCYIKKIFDNYLSKYLPVGEKIDREIELFFWNITDYEKSCDNNTNKRTYSIPKIKGLNYITIYSGENATIVFPKKDEIITFELDEKEYKNFIDFDGELYKKIINMHDVNYTEFYNFNETNINNTKINITYSEIIFRNKIKYTKRINETFINNHNINTILIVNPELPENKTTYFEITYHPIYKNLDKLNEGFDNENFYDEDEKFENEDGNYIYDKIDNEYDVDNLYDVNEEFENIIF
jgi:hypothetical protein